MRVWQVRKKVLLAIIISIATVTGLSGCASSQDEAEAQDKPSVSSHEQQDSFNAQEFIRRGFTDPTMMPRNRSDWSNDTVWTYGLGSCRLTARIRSGNAAQRTWNHMSDAATMLQQSEYAHCTTTVKQNQTHSTRSTTL